MKKLVLAGLVSLLVGCGYAVDDIKNHAEKTLTDNGFTVIGYQGYSMSDFIGGCVWYTFARGDTLYEGCVARWYGEYHLYNIKALNAVTAH